MHITKSTSFLFSIIHYTWMLQYGRKYLLLHQLNCDFKGIIPQKIKIMSLIRHGNVMNVHPSLTWKRKNCSLNTTFFCKQKAYSRSFIKLVWTTDVKSTIFNNLCTAFLGISILSMEGQKALVFHQKYLNSCFWRWTKVLQVCNANK